MQFHLFLAFGYVQTVLPCQFLADTCAAYPLVPVADCPAVTSDTVECDMHVRMLLVKVAHDKNLCVLYTHSLQVFQCNSCHCPVGKAVFVLSGECQCNMSDRLRHPRIHPCLRLKLMTILSYFLKTSRHRQGFWHPFPCQECSSPHP